MKPWHDWNLKIPRLIVVLIALTCWPAALLAEPKLTADNGDALTLHEARCEDPTILAHLLAQWAGQLLERFKQATLFFRGQSYKSCWIEDDGFVYSIDEGGDRLQELPRAGFQDDKI